MGNTARFDGVNFNNLRKALYLMFFGTGNGACNTFSSPKYKYIIPMQGNFENPLQIEDADDTFILYWIERDESLTQDDYVQYGEDAYTRQKCVAHVLVRFIGKEAETWVKTFRHLAKRSNMGQIWSGVCNAEKLEYTSPVIPRKIDYSGMNSQIAFDIRFKLYYDECMQVCWKPLEGIDLTLKGGINKVQWEDTENKEDTLTSDSE